MTDSINPRHYKAHKSGTECIDITEHLPFNLGNAIKYIFRRDLKANATEDMRKAVWYFEREAQRIGDTEYELTNTCVQNMKRVADAEEHSGDPSVLYHVLKVFLVSKWDGAITVGRVSSQSLRLAALFVQKELEIRNNACKQPTP